MLHPIALIALAVLLLNDHVFKEVGPPWLTGKLSDMAGLVVAPLVGSVLIAAAMRRLRARVPSGLPMLLAVLATGCGFAAMKVLPLSADAYRVGLGLIQWPFVLMASLPNLPPIRPVQFVADASDLFTLPMLFVPLWMGLLVDEYIWRGQRRHPGHRAGMPIVWRLGPLQHPVV